MYRRRLYLLLQPESPDTGARIFRLVHHLMVALGIAILLTATVASLEEAYGGLLQIGFYVVAVFFLAEYIARLVAAPEAPGGEHRGQHGAQLAWAISLAGIFGRGWGRSGLPGGLGGPRSGPGLSRLRPGRLRLGRRHGPILLEHQQHASLGHAVADAHPQLRHNSGEWGRHVHRRLVGFQRDQRVLGGDLVPGGDVDLDHRDIGEVADIRDRDVHRAHSRARRRSESTRTRWTTNRAAAAPSTTRWS